MSKRKIKFRGKTRHETEQKWIYGSLLDEEEKDMPMIWHLGIWRPVYEESVGQYTGLKDKNGKEIYEGDVCKVVNFRFGNYAIEWHNGGWCIRSERKFQRVGRTLCSDCFEVIGNVHENPELLEQ